MTQDTVVSLAVQAMTVALKVSMPFLVAGLTVGLLVSIFQAATQINEMTLSFIPKLLAMAAVLALTGPWMIRQLVEYSRNLIESIPGLIG